MSPPVSPPLCLVLDEARRDPVVLESHRSLRPLLHQAPISIPDYHRRPTKLVPH